MQAALIALRRRLRRQPWLTVVGCLLLLYFGYHALNGERGLLAWREYSRELDATRDELAGLRAERAALEQKVARLRHDGLDPDLLDELARRSLSLALPEDVIILLPEGEAR